MAFVSSTPQLGVVDINSTDILAPGFSNLVAGTGSGRYPQPGTIVDAWDPSLGGGKFIYLSVPASTAIAKGILVTWNPNTFVASALPTASGNTGKPVAATLNAIASNTAVQYAWFQIGGTATVLKTAVTVSPNTAIFISGTAGRLYVTSSAGKQILGARTANAATVTSTTSTVLVNFGVAPLMEGA